MSILDHPRAMKPNERQQRTLDAHYMMQMDRDVSMRCDGRVHVILHYPGCDKRVTIDHDGTPWSQD
jgi:hypothetical protein